MQTIKAMCERNANLEAAKQLILIGFTQRAYARDEHDRDLASFQINNKDERNGRSGWEQRGEPVCFCARGALIRVLGLPNDIGNKSMPEFDAISTAARKWWDLTDISVNDSAESVAEVAALFDLAMEEPL